MLLSPNQGGSSGQDTIPAYCFNTDLVGHVVYYFANIVGGLYQVTKVDIDNVDMKKRLGRGIIKSKSGANDCMVQVSGFLTGVYSGLTVGAPLFIGTNSRLQEGPPAEPVTGQRNAQVMGYAVDDAVVQVFPLIPIVLVP